MASAERLTSRPRASLRYAVLGGTLFGLALYAATVAFAVGSAIDEHLHAWWTDARSLVTFDVVMLVVVAAASLPASVAWAMFRRWLPNPTVSVDEAGVVYESRGARRAIAWDELTEVTFEVLRFNVPTLFGSREEKAYSTVLRARDRAIVLHESLDATPAILAAARRAVVERRYPAELARLRAGEPVRFGHVTVGLESIVLRERTVPWKDVLGFGFNDGYFSVRTAKGRFEVPSFRIPNVDVLVALCTRAVEIRSRAMRE